ncbi:MAG: hypothetical protein JWN35_3152 [Frankiales bacterium]|jgi:rRNA maturation protein Nop10|nr:hypothetical protein [Frankiales bacterium]
MTAVGRGVAAGVRARFCPLCGADLDQPRGFCHEYWAGTDRRFLLWCPDCGGTTLATIPARLTSYEPEH